MNYTQFHQNTLHKNTRIWTERDEINFLNFILEETKIENRNSIFYESLVEFRKTFVKQKQPAKRAGKKRSHSPHLSAKKRKALKRYVDISANGGVR